MANDEFANFIANFDVGTRRATEARKENNYYFNLSYFEATSLRFLVQLWDDYVFTRYKTDNKRIKLLQNDDEIENFYFVYRSSIPKRLGYFSCNNAAACQKTLMSAFKHAQQIQSIIKREEKNEFN